MGEVSPCLQPRLSHLTCPDCVTLSEGAKRRSRMGLAGSSVTPSNGASGAGPVTPRFDLQKLHFVNTFRKVSLFVSPQNL